MGGFLQFDLSFVTWMQQLHAPWLDFLMIWVSRLTDLGLIWIIPALIALPFRKTRRAGVSVLLALALGFLLGNEVIKPLVARARPFELNSAVTLLVAMPRGASFPSSHALTCFSAATALFVVNRRLGFAALLFAALVAVSRLYLYVHFLTDVLAGAIIGVLCGLLAARITQRLFQKTQL